MTTFVLAGGCFWCLDAVYRRLHGVTRVESGYTGGDIEDPRYEEVSTGRTGHAEAIKVTFDETIIPADVILDIFFLIHDPTTRDRQGGDVGSQYRSSMFYKNDKQETAFLAAMERARANWGDYIVTDILPLDEFFVAEPEHQDYFNNNPASGYCSIVIAPKISKARAGYAQWFKTV